MEIVREDGRIDKLILAFRYGFPVEETFLKVSVELERLKIPFKKNILKGSGNDKYILILEDIQEEFFDPSVIGEINAKFNISKNTYDFFLGITSEFDICSFTIPEKVVKAFCLIGGNVDISYAAGEE